MSVANRFQNFCTNIRISSGNISRISSRYKRITKQLNKDYWDTESETAHSLYVGSYGRDTDIHVSDVDMVFWLPYSVYQRIDSHQNNGQSALLQEVRNSLQKTYPTSHIGGDGQVVQINFEDGISFEIVPCFENVDDSFTYPDTNNGGAWKKTDPRPEITTIRDGDVKWNKNLKNLCRMARQWKDYCSVPMGGLLIDTLVYNFMSQWQYSDKSYLYYDWMVRDFFFYLKEQNKEQNYWHAVGSNQLVYRKGPFEYKALLAYNLANEAISNEVEGYTYSANEKWRKIFGSKFSG